MRDSPECHRTNSRKLSRWDLAGGSTYVALSLTLARVPPFRFPASSFRCQPARLLAPPRSPCPFLVGFIFTYLLLCTGDSGTKGSDTIGASENTEDTYCSVLFTASPILRDVGVPISATFALFFPLLRRPVFTNSRAPYVLYTSSVSLCTLYLPLLSRSADSTRCRYHAMLLPKNCCSLTKIFHR